LGERGAVQVTKAVEKLAGFAPATSRMIVWCSAIELKFVCLCRRARSPERPGGVEPPLPPGQDGRLPLLQGRMVFASRIVKEPIESTRRDLNPHTRPGRPICCRSSTGAS